jgi:hypothetical protein
MLNRARYARQVPRAPQVVCAKALIEVPLMNMLLPPPFGRDCSAWLSTSSPKPRSGSGKVREPRHLWTLLIAALVCASPAAMLGASTASLSRLTCSSSSATGYEQVGCTVTLSGPASGGGVSVSLASSNAAVSVPASITVPSGAASAVFPASVDWGSLSSGTATLTASGGGASRTWILQLLPATETLTASATAVTFGNVPVNTAATQAIVLKSAGNMPVILTSISKSGSAFAVNGVKAPITLNPGSTATLNVQFKPTATGAATGKVTVNSTDDTNGSQLVISLSGTGGGSTTPALSALTCSSGSLTGTGTDACTVLLTSAATSGTTVSLSSSSSSVTVPASVTIAAGATSAGFTATATAVSTNQTATLSATAGGIAKTFALTLNATAPGLTLSSNSVAFGTQALNTTVTKTATLTSSGTAPLTITGAAVSGTGFTDSGISLPLTLNKGQTATLTISFDPTTSGSFTGLVAISSNAAPATLSLSGTGQAPASLSALTCSSGLLTGAGTDACTVSLTSAATSATTVSLASSSSAVTVPGSIKIPAGSTIAGFTATVTAVTANQTATMTATAGGLSKTFAIALNAATPILTLSGSTIAFGNVNLNTPATQSITLTSTGTAAVMVNAASVTGAGFSISGTNFPMTLNPGQSATLNVQFNPSAAGSVTGSIALSGNCAMGAMSISLNGTGAGSSGGSYSLPNDNNGCPGNCRQIQWQTGSDLWNGGALPVYPSVTCSGLAGNGSTDDGPKIQACINSAAANTAVFLPAGTYYVNSTVRLKSNVALRGAKAEGGPPFMPAADSGSTTILLGSSAQMTTQNFSPSSGSMDPSVSYGSNAPGYKIGNAPKKGDTTFTIGSGTLTAGQWISVFADNDPKLVNSTGEDGDCPWCGENTPYRDMVQITQVTAVNGTTATISPAFYYTLYNNPEYRRYSMGTVKAGFENLRFDGSKHDIGGTQIILIQGCAYCWVKNLETYMTGSNSGSAHVEFDYSFGGEVRDSAMHDQRSGASGSGYGIYLQFANSAIKAENNILYHNRHWVVFQGAAAGNTFLYNYADDGYTDDLTYLASGRTSHGAHPFMNLFEGNIISHITADDFSGTSSHTVFFRNWIRGGESNHVYSGGSGIQSFPPDNGFDAVDLYPGQTYYSFVDNVLGNAGLGGGISGTWSKATLSTFDEYSSPDNPTVYSMGGSLGSTPSSASTAILQGNYDYLTQGVAYGTGATYAPSLYYSTKPAFIGTCPFPQLGSDLAPVDTLLQPAYERAMGGSCQ